MIRRPVLIRNKLGLHARASAKLVQTALAFSAHIVLSREGKTANAKGMLDVMMLAASQGTELWLEADGDDAVAALDALEALIDRYFDEGE